MASNDVFIRPVIRWQVTRPDEKKVLREFDSERIARICAETLAAQTGGKIIPLNERGKVPE